MSNQWSFMCSAALALALLTPAGASAQTAAKDPATGKARKLTAEEAKALGAQDKNKERQASQGRERVEEVALPTGGFRARADEGSMSYSVARKSAKGKVSIECVQGEKAAQKAMRKPATEAAPKTRATVKGEVQ